MLHSGRRQRCFNKWVDQSCLDKSMYRMFFKNFVISLKFRNFSVLLQRWLSTCLVCVHTLTPRENRERPKSGIFLILWEKTQYLMNTLYVNTRYPVVPDTTRTTVKRIRISHLWNSFYSRTRENLHFIYYNPLFSCNQINYFDWHNNRLYELKKYNYTFYEWSVCNNNNN